MEIEYVIFWCAICFSLGGLAGIELCVWDKKKNGLEPWE